MYPINKILVPTDLSENAKAAYKPAQELASRYGAKINLIHAIPSSKNINDSAIVLSMYSVERNEMFNKLKERAARRLTEIMEDEFKPESRGEIIIEVNTNPTQAIAEQANIGNYDLMVMALKGQHETEFLRGSITQRVMRSSKIPVLTIGPDGLNKINNVLVPIDGSTASFNALPLAASFASTFNAPITLLYIVVLQWVSVASDLRPSKKEKIKNEILATLEHLLRKSTRPMHLHRNANGKNELVFDSNSETIKLNIIVETGISANTAIADYANEKAGITVMTTHGRSGLSHLLMGSVAEMLSQQISKPIITIKPRYIDNRLERKGKQKPQQEV